MRISKGLKFSLVSCIPSHESGRPLCSLSIFPENSCDRSPPLANSVACFPGSRSSYAKLRSPGQIFNYPYRKTWEFTNAAPIRSIFPLWPVYALPLLILKGIWVEIGAVDVPPEIVYYSLRLLMFILSFVLEDWAILEIVQSPEHRKLALTLTASSYVTWTYQTHTFSNSIETLAVLWSLVMIQRIRDNKVS